MIKQLVKKVISACLRKFEVPNDHVGCNSSVGVVGKEDEHLLGLVWQSILRLLAEPLYLLLRLLKLRFEIGVLRLQTLYLRVLLSAKNRKLVALSNRCVALNVQKLNLLTQ